jgi:pimeloyl-ACP methyl ester carboxylesterase
LLTLFAGLVSSGPLSAAAARASTTPVTVGTTQSAAKRATVPPTRLIRLSVFASADAYRHPHLALLTLGGPNYCGLLQGVATAVKATRICVDYARFATAEPQKYRIQDFGDPAYLDAVARVPNDLRRQGLKISKLVLIGASYAGFDVAELAATHPELRPAALVVVDSFLDLPARYLALPLGHATRKYMELVLGGTLKAKPTVYAARSPSNHLNTLAALIHGGMPLVIAWSVAASEKREFLGGTCSLTADASWVAELSTLVGRPLIAQVTTLAHADLLRNWGEHLLARAGILPPLRGPLPGRPVTFAPGAAAPPGSYC